ncbi:hypothetical protein Trydic_g9013 [Trypoxylus dichotomus]
MLSFLVSFCGVVSLTSAASYDLPSYIERCSLSDPNLNECFKEKANLAIPFLAKGDKELGIPQAAPVTIPVAPSYSSDFKFILYDAYSESLRDLKVTKVLFDLKTGKVDLEANLNSAVLTAKNYTILNGTIVGVKASGHGAFNMTLANLAVYFKADIRKFKKGGEDYFELANSQVTSSVERGYYYFENLKSEEKDDMNAYIDENWKKFRLQLKPTIESYLKTFIYYPINVIFNRVPINKMFLP